MPKACRLWLASSLSAPTPVPAGLCRRARHESAQARHENLYRRSSIARKCYRGFIERASRREGLVDLNACDKIDVREGACPHAPCALRLNARCCSRMPRRVQSTSHYCSLNVRAASEGFSRIDVRLTSFRVARNARFRDRGAGATPGAGVAADAGDARQSRRLRPSRRRRTRQSRIARCPRLWFVVKKQARCRSCHFKRRLPLNLQ